MPLKSYGTLDSLPTDIEDSTNVRTPVLCWLPTPGIDNKHQYTWATLCVCIEMCEKRQRFKKLGNLGCLWNKHYTLLAHSAGKSPYTTAKCGENPRKMVLVHVGVPLWSLSVQHPLLGLSAMFRLVNWLCQVGYFRDSWFFPNPEKGKFVSDLANKIDRTMRI